MIIKERIYHYEVNSDMNLDELALEICKSLCKKPTIELSITDINTENPVEFYFLCCGHMIILKSGRSGKINIAEQKEKIPIFKYIADLTTDEENAVNLKYLASYQIVFKKGFNRKTIIRIVQSYCD